jgi:protein TonB
MTALALHHHADDLGVRRYGAAAITIVLLYLAVIAAALVWYERPPPAGVSLQPIFVELAPAPAAQKIQAQDNDPGPQERVAETPPPEPPKVEKIEEQLPPTPMQPEPVVAAPPKQEAKPEPKTEPAPPKPVKEVKKPAKRLVQQSTAAKADRVAPEAPAQTSGTSAAAAAASYRAMLVAHLQRFKQYPSSANGARGRAAVSITITRSGRVTGSRLVQSSGNGTIDQAVLALVQRAQPMPPFPPEMREASETFTAPFNFVPDTLGGSARF